MRLAALFALCLLDASRARAHDFTVTETVLTLQTSGRFQVEMTCDLDALALGVSSATDDAELVRALHGLPPGELARHIERLRDLFRRRVRVRFDDAPEPFEVSFPEYGTAAADAAVTPTLLGVVARLQGTIPPEAHTVSFVASRAFPVVHLTINDERRGIETREVLQYGDPSQAFSLAANRPSGGLSALPAVVSYLALGFRHIVPDGIDHVLFVLGLFLLNTRLRSLMWQITAFTVAHALTLAVAVSGAVTLSPVIVEPLIALSIAYVAFENLATDELKPWRPAVVFGFGLLHGLGFASVLTGLGLPPQERLTALVAFNAGIELGQLATLGAAFAILGWCRHRGWYRTRVARPLSMLIGSTGLVWAVERVL